MQLKSLQIQGFKSFPDKTTLTFSRGLTSVVGPNGSGKSNISDAVRWVMGEQSTKNLRGEKMEDIIFLGTHNRKPTGFASVSLTIDNIDRQLPVDSDDVTITRKLFRSGESEYRINKTAVRLRDINEMFMDTGLGRDGYSIIGQGKIEEIVSAKSNQRREIFEEAAGISKYRYRKAEAEKRLESAYDNLLRLKDIMAELESRVGPLQEQAKKAEEFLRLAEEKKVTEISLWMNTLRRSQELIAEQEGKILTAKNKCSDLQAILDEFQCRLDDGYEEMQKCSVEVEQKRKSISDMKTELSNCDAEIAVLNNDIAHNTKTISELQEDILRYTQSKETNAQKLSEWEQEMERKQEELSALRLEQEQAESQLSSLTARLEDSSSGVAQLKSKRAALEQDIALQKLNKASSSTLLEETAARLKNIEVFQTDRAEAVTAACQEVQHCEELLAGIEDQLLSLRNASEGYRLKGKAKDQELEGYSAKQAELKAQIEKNQQKSKILTEMEQSLEGYYSSVRHVMTESKRGNLQGIRGPVSQLISTKGEYSVAIETALGSAMQNIVVETEDAAKKAIQSLKFSKAGRATFLPLNVIRPQTLNVTGWKQEKGAVGIAADLVSCDGAYRNMIQNLLGRIVVAENLDCAVEIARKFKYQFRIVTLDGQLVNAGGSLTGGSAAKNFGILSRKDEIEKLNQTVRGLQLEMETFLPKIKAVQEERAALAAELSGLEAQLLTVQEDKITYTSELKRLKLGYEEAVKAQEDMQKEYTEMQKRWENLKNTSSSANSVIAGFTAELEQVQDQIEREKGAAEKLGSEKEALTGRVQEIRFQTLAVTKDLESLRSTYEQLSNMHQEQQQQGVLIMEKINALQKSNDELNLNIQYKLERKKFLLGAVNKENLSIADIINQRSAIEQKMNDIRESERTYIAQKERAAAELARSEDRSIVLKNEYDKTIARLWDEYGMTRSQGEEIAVAVDNEDKMKGRLIELKNKIRALGTVNVSAIEEYRELHERYTFLKKQMDDVENSRTELIRMIHELTSQMRALFSENFKKINEHFRNIFQELFMGGQGELVLSNPDDVLESGIEINVQPPGKIIKNISSLSGGEKAFVAIAIYFAILKVRPSPFCILDEIEAALDEVNVSRYARYLKLLADKTQFIAITHRRGTMEESDVMYGVTMQEKGVSKLLELDVTQVENKLGIHS